jgi:hypothetical protein
MPRLPSGEKVLLVLIRSKGIFTAPINQETSKQQSSRASKQKLNQKGIQMHPHAAKTDFNKASKQMLNRSIR